VIKRKYGLSKQQYSDLLKSQNNSCKICHTPYGEKAFAVDHCHKTGRVRGILCISCNTAIGMLKEDPIILRQAIDYLEE
jgi:hypothetical protein